MAELMYRRVYKFLAAEHALDDLEHGRVKIATVDDLNDPFDLFAVDTTHPAIAQARETLVKEFRKEGPSVLQQALGQYFDVESLWLVPHGHLPRL